VTFPATDRLYSNDSLALSFGATLLGATYYQKKPALVLDRSAFYPEGGGQPGDWGTLTTGKHSITVTDVQVDDAGVVYHLVNQAPASPDTGIAVQGMIDGERRRDYMSQHTGQHMLSSLLDQTLDMPTVSARLGSTTSTIDLEGDPDRFDPATVAELESRLNTLVLEDRPIRILYPTQAELSQIGLRRAPKVAEGIRIIEIEGFDLTPCGGTHCRSTGQVGPIKLVGKERYKGLTRLSFLAGTRALRYLTQHSNLLLEACASVGCNPEELLGHFQRQREELKTQGQVLGQLRSQIIRAEVQEILAEPETAFQEPRVFVRESEDQRSSRLFAGALAEHPQLIALIASREQDNQDWRIILLSGSARDFDCGAWFRGPGKVLGARGGGKPFRAEGLLPADVDPRQLQL